METSHSYKVGKVLFSKRDIYVSFFGLFIGTLIGVSTLSFLIPDAGELISMYSNENNTLEQIKRGEIQMPGDMWLHHAKSMKAKSQNEYISDMINLNNTVLLMNNRLQFGLYPSSTSLKEFGNKIAENRNKENAELVELNIKTP